MRIKKIRHCLAMVFAIGISPIYADAWADVCEDVNTIISQANNDQDSGLKKWINGNYNGDPDRYVPSFVLPRSEECTMDFDYGQDYTCYWNFKSEKDLRNSRVEIVNSLRKCDVISKYGFREEKKEDRKEGGYTERHYFINITEEQEQIDGQAFMSMAVRIRHISSSYESNRLSFSVSVSK